MSNFFDNATDVTPGTAGSWQDVDVSAYVPAGATGVILQVVSTSGTTYAFGLRKKGSTDNRTANLQGNYHTWGYIGLDANRVFQAYVANLAVKLKLLGYFTSDGSFFTDAYNKTPGGSGSWVDIDCSAEIPSGAKYAIVELIQGSNTPTVGLRPKGSTDDRQQSPGVHTFALVGLDANRVFQYNRSSTDPTLYLVGYLTQGTPKTNGVDVSLGSTGAYADIDRSGDGDASGAVGVLVEVVGLTYQTALRKNGGTDDFYKNQRHNWAAVGLDTGKVFEGKISDLSADFFVVGYFAGGSQTWEYTGSIGLALTPQSAYHQPFTKTYVGSIPLALTPQGIYGLVIIKEYVGSLPVSLLPQGLFDQAWSYVGSVPVALSPQGGFLFAPPAKVYTGSISLLVSPQGDYLAIYGRQPIPGPYVLRYPSPRNGETNVPVKNGIRFTIKSDGPGIDIDKVTVKIVDSWGTNVYDKTSPYFKYSGNKQRYEVVVLPPQAWQYEEDVQAELEAEDLEGRRGIAYEYVP